MVQVIQAEEGSTPVQCVTDPTGRDGYVVYGDEQLYPITPVRNRFTGGTSPVDNSTGVGGGFEQQRSEAEQQDGNSSRRATAYRVAVAGLLMVLKLLLHLLQAFLVNLVYLWVTEASLTRPWLMIILIFAMLLLTIMINYLE